MKILFTGTQIRTAPICAVEIVGGFELSMRVIKNSALAKEVAERPTGANREKALSLRGRKTAG